MEEGPAISRRYEPVLLAGLLALFEGYFCNIFVHNYTTRFFPEDDLFVSLDSPEVL